MQEDYLKAGLRYQRTQQKEGIEVQMKQGRMEPQGDERGVGDGFLPVFWWGLTVRMVTGKQKLLGWV